MKTYCCCCLIAQLLAYLMRILSGKLLLILLSLMLAALLILNAVSFIFIRSQARYRVPTRSVDLIITELLVYRSASALFLIVILVSSPTFVQFFAFRSPTWFFAAVCSVLRLSLSDFVLRRRLFNSLPFALGLVSCFFAVVCSAPASIIFTGFYTLANAKTSFM